MQVRVPLLKHSWAEPFPRLVEGIPFAVASKASNVKPMCFQT